MKRIGVFSGSFNPIHIGHLALANWICEYAELDEIWFLVTPQSPLKDKDELMDYDLRFNMVKEAIGDYPKFKVSDIECTLPLPSYTINTLRTLQNNHPDDLFHLIIGADSWANINQWKEAEALINEFPILIYPRSNYKKDVTPLFSNIRKAGALIDNHQFPHLYLADAPLIDISSSLIRSAIREGKDIRFFLPEAIREKIDLIKNM